MNLEDAWDACLKIWERLSVESPGEEEDVFDLKIRISREVTGRYVLYGCPFCEGFNPNCVDSANYSTAMKCRGCPIFDKERTYCEVRSPYAKWYILARRGQPCNEAAREFHEYLVKLRGEVK